MKKIEALKKGIDKKDFVNLFIQEYPGFSFEELFDILKFQGLPLILKNEKVFLKTALISYKDAEYVVVDIEVNNSKPQKGQVIEIGAVKIKDLKIVDSFDFLIYADDVPIFVERVTGINQKMLQNEKSQKEILKKFRLFLGDAVFIAHPADFDFNFLNYQFEKENLGKLLNRHLCTLALSQKTIEAKRYGLKYLMEELNLPEETHHRALSDAKTTARVFFKSLENLSSDIVKAEDLIEFAKPQKNKNPKKSKKKKD